MNTNLTSAEARQIEDAAFHDWMTALAVQHDAWKRVDILDNSDEARAYRAAVDVSRDRGKAFEAAYAQRIELEAAGR